MIKSFKGAAAVLAFLLSVVGATTGAVLYVTRADDTSDKSIALIDQRLTAIETNHLKHIELYMSEMSVSSSKQGEDMAVMANDISTLKTEHDRSHSDIEAIKRQVTEDSAKLDMIIDRLGAKE
jgi:hypothetical protein